MDRFEMEVFDRLFKYKLGEVVAWKLADGSRVLISERALKELEPGIFVRTYTGSVGAVGYAGPQPLEFQEHELAALVKSGA